MHAFHAHAFPATQELTCPHVCAVEFGESMLSSCDYLGPMSCCEKAGAGCRHQYDGVTATKSTQEWYYDVPDKERAQYAPIFTLDQHWPQTTVEDYYACNNTIVITAAQEQPGGAHYSYFGALDKITVSTANAVGESPESEPIYVRSLSLSVPPELNGPPLFILGGMLNVKWHKPIADGEVWPDNRELIITFYHVVVRLGYCGTFGEQVEELKFGSLTMEANIELQTITRGELYCVSVAASNVLGKGFETAMGKQFYALETPGPVRNLEVSPLLGQATLCISWDEPIDHGLGPNRPLRLVTGLERRLWLNYTVTVSESPLELDPDNSLVFLNTSGTNLEFDVIDGALTSVTLDKSILRKGVRYYVAVRAKNAAFLSSFEPASACAIFPPDRPRDATGQVSGNLQVNISWANPLDSGEGSNRNDCLSDNIYTYMVQASDNQEFAPLYTFNASAEHQNLLFTSPYRFWYEVSSMLVKNKVTYYRVFAQNLAGTSNASETVSLRSATSASSPTQVRTRVFSENSITLDISPPVDTGYGDSAFPILGYKVQFSRSSTFSDSLVEKEAIANSSGVYTAGDLLPGVMYNIRAAAMSLAGQGTWSNTVAERGVGAPSAPRSPVVEVSGHLSLKLSWKLPSDLGQDAGFDYPVKIYEVEVASSATFSDPEFVDRYVPAMHQVQVSESIEPVTMTYTNEGQFLEMSGSRTIGHIISTVPVVNYSRPCDCTTLCTHVIGVPVCQVVNAELCPSVSDEFEPAGFRACMTTSVSRMANLEAQSIDILLQNSGLPLVKGLLYFLRVRAVNNVGASVYSQPISQRAISRPSEPLNVRGQVNFKGVYLRWDPPLETGIGGTALALESYLVRYSGNNFSSGHINFTQVASTRQSVTIPHEDLRDFGRLFSFQVIAINIASMSAPSDRGHVEYVGRAEAPSILSVVWPSGSGEPRARISWSPPADFGSGEGMALSEPVLFQVQTSRSKDFEEFESDFTEAYDFVLRPATLTLTKTGLLRGSTYFFRVLCITALGFGYPSHVFRAVSLDLAPRVLTVLPASIASSSPTAMTVVVDGAWLAGETSILNPSLCKVTFQGFSPRDANDCYLYSAAIPPSGLKWESSGTFQPSQGRELTNAQLQQALMRQTEFTSQEWNAFSISGLRVGDYIRVGQAYLTPATVEIKRVVYKFDSPHLPGGDTRSIAGTLSYGTVTETPPFAVTALHASTPSVISVTGPGVVKGSESNTWIGAEAGSSVVVAAAGFPAFQTLKVTVDQGGDLLTLQRMDVMLASSADSPSFVHMTLPGDTLEGIYRVNISEAMTGASVSLRLTVSDPTRMHVVEMLPSFGAAGQPFHIHLKNAGDLTLANATFDTLFASCAPAAGSSTRLLCTAPDLANHPGTIPVTVASERGKVVVHWQVLSRTTVSSLQINSKNAPEYSELAEQGVLYVGQNVAARFSVRTNEVDGRADPSRVTGFLRDSAGFLVTLKHLSLAYVTGGEIGVDVMLWGVSQYTADFWDGTVYNNLIPEVYDLVVDFDGALSERSSVLRVLPSGVCEATVSPSAGPADSAFLVTVTLAFSSSHLPIPFPTEQLQAFIGETGIAITSTQSNPTSTTLVMRMPAGGAGNVAHVEAIGANGVESCAFLIEEAPASVCPSAVTWASSTTAPASGGSRLEVHLSHFPYVDNLADIKIELDYGATAAAIDLEPGSMTWSADTTKLTIDLPAVRIGVANVTISIRTESCASLIMDFQDSALPAMSILSPIVGAYVSSPVDVTLQVSGMPEVSSMEDVHVTMDGEAMTVVSFTSGQPGAGKSASGRSIPGPISIVARMSKGNASLALVAVSSLKGQALSAFGLLDFQNRPTNPVVRAVSPATIPSTGTVVHLEIGNFMHVADPSLLMVLLIQTNGPDQIIPIVDGSVRSSLVDLSLQVEVPDLSALGGSDVVHLSVRYDSGGTEYARADAAITLQDQTRAQVVRAWPTMGPMRGGTRVVMEILHFDEVSLPDQVTICSPQGCTRALRLERSDESIFIEFENLPLNGPQPANTTMQILPFGKLDESSAPRFDFEYLPSVPALTLVTPAQLRLSGGNSVVVSVSSMPVDVIAADLTVHVGAQAAQVVGIHYPTVDLQGPSASHHADAPNESTATIQFIAPAQLSAGSYVVRLLAPAVDVSGTVQYNSPPPPAEITNVQPAQGALEGGWYLSLYLFHEQTLDADHLTVNVDDVVCRVTEVTQRDGGAMTVRIIVPPHDAGVAALKVYTSPQHPEAAFASQLLAVGSVKYQDSTSLKVRTVHAPIRMPDATEIVTLSLSATPSKLLLSDVSVTLNGRACKPLRLVLQDSSNAVLSFEVPLLSARGMLQGSVSLSRSGRFSTSADFAMYLKNAFTTQQSASPTVRRVSTSRGAPSGGSVLRLAIENFAQSANETVASMGPDVQVRFGFGLEPARSKTVIRVTRDETELEIVTPASTCTDLCTVSVAVSLVSNPAVSVAFPFTYEAPGTRVLTVEPSLVSQNSGERIFIVLENAPLIDNAMGLQIFVDGQAVDRATVQLLSKAAARASVSFMLPRTSSHGKLACHLVPLLGQHGSAEFALEVKPASKPYMVSMWPSVIVAGRASRVDLIVAHYPVYPLGSFDRNYQDISGPQPASLQVAGETIGASSLVLAKIARGGYSVNATSQLSFDIMALNPGRKHVTLIARDTPVLEFELHVVPNGSTPLVLLDPSEGPMQGAVTTIHLAGFDYAAESRIVVMVSGRAAEILDVAKSADVTSLTVAMPQAANAGPAHVSVSSSSTVPAVLHLDFVYLKPCDSSHVCGAVDLAPLPLLPGQTSLSRDPTVQTCDASVCTSLAQLHTPRVEMLSVSQGADIGGDPVRIVVSGLGINQEDVLVMFGDSAAHVVHASSSLAASQMIADIRVISPPHLSNGVVTGAVRVAGNALPAATFRFQYFSTVNATLAQVSPSSCYPGSMTEVVVAVQGWRPVATAERLNVDTSYMSPVHTFVNASVVTSDWSITKVRFTLQCPIAEGKTTLALVRPQGFEGHVSMKMIPFGMSVERPQLALRSMFPSLGPKEGGTLVLMRVSNIIGLDSSFLSLRQATDASTIQQLTNQISAIMNVSFVLNGSHVPVDLETVNQDSSAEVEMTFRSPQHYDAAEVPFKFGGGTLGSPVRLTWKFVKETVAGVESVTTRTSPREGGSLVMLSLYGFRALRPRMLVEAEGNRYEDEIVVAFGSLKAEIVRVRESAPYPGRTVVDYRVPSSTLAGDTTVLIYRSSDSISSAASYTHTYVDMPTSLDVSRGSTRGGIVVSVTSYAFAVERESALEVLFEQTPATVIPDSLHYLDGRTTFSFLVPASPSVSSVVVRIRSLISEQAAEVTFEYFGATEIHLAEPSYGLSSGGTRIEVSISQFPVVSSASKLAIEMGVGPESVSASAMLVSSDYERTKLVIFTPVGRFSPHTRSLPISIIPLEFDTQQERDDNKVTFDFLLIASPVQVVSVLPASIPAFTESSIVLQVEGFPPELLSNSMSVMFGDIRTSVAQVISADSELTVLQVHTPRLPARAGGYTCSVDYGLAGTADVSASFVLHVEDTTLLVVSAHGTSGASSGQTKMTVELAGSVRPHAIDDVVIRFGEGVSAVFVRAREVHDDGVMTKMAFIAPPYSGASQSGRAQVKVTISVRQEREAAVNLMFTYLTPLRVESSTLAADASSLDIHFDQPSNLRPRADLVLRNAVGDGGGPDTDCTDIFEQQTLNMMGTGPKCYVVSSSHVHVQLGRMPSVLPSFTGSLHQGIQAKASESLQETEANQPPKQAQHTPALVTFMVTGMLGDEAPLWGGIVGPSQIGPCEAAVFELITSSLQEPVSAEWSISSDSIAVQESGELEKLSELVSAETGVSLTLRPGDLPTYYVDFTLRIRILTAMGKTSMWTHQVLRTEWPIPTAKLLSALSFSTIQPMQAIAEARASQCLRLASVGALDAELRYAWSLTNADGPQALAYTGSDLKHLRSVPQIGTKSEQVAVEVFARSDPVSIATARIHFTFQPAPIVAMIAGGDRAVSAAEVVSLSVLAYDRDYPNLVLQYRWSCSSDTFSACRRADGSLLDLSMTQTLVISEATLLAGKTYSFAVMVTSEDGRMASATSRISVWQGSIEHVGLALAQQGNSLTCGVDSINVGSNAFFTSTSSAPQVVWALQWAEDEQDEGDVQDLYSQALSIQEVDGQIAPEISIDTTGFGIPTTYVFVAATRTGRSWCPVTLNMPPSGGSCTAIASGPRQLIMPTEVHCSGFAGLYTPFTYAVGAQVDGEKWPGKPSYHSRQSVPVLYNTANVLVRITDRRGASREVLVPVQTAQSTSGPTPQLDAAGASAVLTESVTDDIVMRNIFNVALNARSAQIALHDTLLSSLILRLLPMVQAAPPSAELFLRVIPTLLVATQIMSPMTGLRHAVAEMLLAVLHQSSLQGLSESELRQCVTLISNIYAQEETAGHTPSENFRFALAMEKFASSIGKATLRYRASNDPALNIHADRVTVALLKVAPRDLPASEFHFHIPVDGTTATLVLPSELPAALDHTGTADLHIAQHRAMWAAGGERLLSYPVSFSVSSASSPLPLGVDFGDQEVHVTLPFNATSLSSLDMDRVYRGEGVSCVTWQGDEAGLNENQPWTAKGCRIETVRRALDAGGEDVPGLGSVVCACSHLSTFALSFREEPVRFEDPTPHAGDLLVITAGHLLHLPVRAASNSVDKTVTLSQLSMSPALRSFVDPVLSPAIASSALQPQFDAELALVSANISWTPMLPGSYTVSLGLFAGGTGKGAFLLERVHRVILMVCENLCVMMLTFGLQQMENLLRKDDSEFWYSSASTTCAKATACSQSRIPTVTSRRLSRFAVL